VVKTYSVRVSAALGRVRERFSIIVALAGISLWMDRTKEYLQGGIAARTQVQVPMGFALSRFGRRITSVMVSLDDGDGPKGGLNKRGRVVVRV
jgi:hypothetical protein